MCNSRDHGSIWFDVIFTDISKAFDKLDILMQKLCNFGLTELFMQFFSIIENKKFDVQYHNYKSLIWQLHLRYAKDRYLDLYSVFINNISFELQFSSLLYPDDCKLFAPIKDFSDFKVTEKQKPMRYRLFLNINKRSCVSFTRRTNAKRI